MFRKVLDNSSACELKTGFVLSFGQTFTNSVTFRCYFV